MSLCERNVTLMLSYGVDVSFTLTYQFAIKHNVWYVAYMIGHVFWFPYQKSLNFSSWWKEIVSRKILALEGLTKVRYTWRKGGDPNFNFYMEGLHNHNYLAWWIWTYEWLSRNHICCIRFHYKQECWGQIGIKRNGDPYGSIHME